MHISFIALMEIGTKKPLPIVYIKSWCNSLCTILL